MLKRAIDNYAVSFKALNWLGFTAMTRSIESAPLVTGATMTVFGCCVPAHS